MTIVTCSLCPWYRELRAGDEGPVTWWGRHYAQAHGMDVGRVRQRLAEFAA